jgi:hypothetical protein
MRTTQIYRLFTGFCLVIMIAGLTVMPGTTLADNGGLTPPHQVSDDSTSRFGDVKTGSSEGTTASSIAAEALLLILTTL